MWKRVAEVLTRIIQHQKFITDEKWDTRGVSDAFCWTETKLLKTEEGKFERKVREALEIQLQQTSPHSDQGLNQEYVTTKNAFVHTIEVTIVCIYI